MQGAPAAIKKTDLVKKFSTGQKFKIFDAITLDTVGVVYLNNGLKGSMLENRSGPEATVGIGKKCVKVVGLWVNALNHVRTSS